MTEPATPSPTPVGSPAGSAKRGLSRSVLLAYGIPGAAYQGAAMPISIWLMKFSTDVLLIPAAAMGVIVMVARLWDAVSDPVAGFLSDRTRSRFGRRRVWMLGSTLPILATLVMLWSPPSSLQGVTLVLWMGFAYVLWETASTGFLVPYSALGNELTDDYHERTRLFAWKHVTMALGFAVGMGLVYLIRTGEDPRRAAMLAAIGAGAVVALSIFYAARHLHEPPHHQGRGAVNLRASFRDVFSNPHARILLAVYTIEAFGMGSVSFMAPYILDDVIGRVEFLEAILVCWTLPQFALTPLWVNLSRRIGKKRLWLVGMAIYASGFAFNMFMAEGRVELLFFTILLLGTGGGISSVIAPAIQADVIDWDELRTGERKEGAYTAVWNLIRKSGWALAAGLGGLALSWAGYDGAAEVQPPQVTTVLLFVGGALPASGYVVGLLLFLRFRLNEAEHTEVMAQLETRKRTP